MFVLPWFPIFVLFSPAFFILCFVSTCLLWWAIEVDSGKRATVFVIGFLLTITLFGSLDIWKWMYNNPLHLVICIGMYVLIGVVWAVIRWAIFCYDDYKDYEEVKVDWLQRNNQSGNTIPKGLKDDFLCYLYTSGNRKWLKWVTVQVYEPRVYNLELPRRSRNYKWSIMTWMAYWPFSASWWILRDLLRKLWERLYHIISGTLDKISALIYRKINRDFQ
jgi:hypothetical protein